jgi:PAS domain-containing protein
MTSTSDTSSPPSVDPREHQDPKRKEALCFAVLEQDPKRKEALCFAVIEEFPTMIFSKDASPQTRHNDRFGFRYVYFNALMDHVSGLKRLDMIGQNANDHFNPTDARQYFVDDRRVMTLPPNGDDDAAVLDFYEPWVVPTGKHVNHTRKKNLGDAYMLGTFLVVDDLHLGKVEERRRPVLLPLSEAPPSPAPYFFSEALEHLPVPVLVVSMASSSPSSSSSFSSSPPVILLKNRAYHHAFGSPAAATAAATSKDEDEGEDEGEAETAVDKYLLGLNSFAVPGAILERSNVVFGRGDRRRAKRRREEQRGEEKGMEEVEENEITKWHVTQRPVPYVEREGERENDMGDLVLVYVLWPQGDESKAAAARAKLK